MSSPSLHDLQGAFWRAIATTPGALAAGDDLLGVTMPSARLDAAARLRVYVDAYFWRLRDALAEDFPRLASVLGAELFEGLARDYLLAEPSPQPSIRHLGDAFPAFVARSATLPPHLGDLARLERARTDVFDAPDDVPLTIEHLRRIDPADWPELRFAPLRALTVLRLDWPVHELWGDVACVPLVATPTALRVWRGTDYRVFHAVLDERALRALERLVAGDPFGTICGAFDDLPPEEGARQATALLARWLEDGIIAHTAGRHG